MFISCLSCLHCKIATFKLACRAYALLDHYGRLEGSEEEASVFVRYGSDTCKAAVIRTPEKYEPTNILGLSVIDRHGFRTDEASPGRFAFKKPFPAYL